MLTLIVTSLMRTRLGLRSWRLVHWSAYLCWPVAVLHGLGTGTDTPVRWVLVLTAGCVLAVAGLEPPIWHPQLPVGQCSQVRRPPVTAAGGTAPGAVPRSLARSVS